MKRQRRAYTLLEVVLTMAVIVIVAGISFPSVRSMYVQHKVRAASDSIRAGLVGARSHAVDESRRYRFSVVSGKGNYRIAPDDPKYWSGSSPDSDEQQPPYIHEDALPSGIRFTHEGDSGDQRGDTVQESVSAGQWETLAIFESDGTAQDDAEITIDLSGARPMVIRLRSITGNSTVEYGKVK